jgi:hypothetical protein
MARQGGVARPRGQLTPLDLPGWKNAASWLAAIPVGILFLVSGVWMITDVQGAPLRLAETLPEPLADWAALPFGIAGTVAGALLLVPRFRRWGAIAAAALLLAFLIFAGLHYRALRGEDCGCFPWVKIAIAPPLLCALALMAFAAALAGMWSKPARGLRGAVMVLGAVTVFAGVSWGAVTFHQTGARAPDSVQVDGQPYSLRRGRIFLYFFDPMCSHCLDVATRMAKFDWRGTPVVAVPVEEPRFAPQFLADSGLRAVVTTDFDKLAAAFSYRIYPFGVVLENGRRRQSLTDFDGPEPAATLRKLGLVR